MDDMVFRYCCWLLFLFNICLLFVCRLLFVVLESWLPIYRSSASYLSPSFYRPLPPPTQDLLGLGLSYFYLSIQFSCTSYRCETVSNDFWHTHWLGHCWWTSGFQNVMSRVSKIVLRNSTYAELGVWLYCTFSTFICVHCLIWVPVMIVCVQDCHYLQSHFTPKRSLFIGKCGSRKAF